MACKKSCGRGRKKALAPEFAKKLASLIEERVIVKRVIAKQLKVSRRNVASTLGIDPAAVHRLCTTGAGSEENICKILKHLGEKPRRIREILAARRAELSEGEAREIWKDFRYAFPNTREYMAELCPFPLERACSSTYAGISMKYIFDLAKEAKIEHIGDLTDLKSDQLVSLYAALAQEYGSAKAMSIFSQKADKNIPLMIHLDIFQYRDAADYAILSKCDGKSLFGIPHVVLTHYVFRAGGEVGAHRHAGGVELLHSLEGSFQIEYKGIQYPRLLDDDGSVIALDSRKYHSIRLATGDRGHLLVVRYDPRRRHLPPGPTLFEMRRRQDARKRRKTDLEKGV